MGRLVVVGNDPVRGTDRHNVTGMGPNPNPPPPTLVYSGIGEFEYRGTVTDQLSDLVWIGDLAVALVTSRSALDPGETAPLAGKHSGRQGTNFVASGPAPRPTEATLRITDAPLGTGVPNAGAGSTLLTVNGVRVLLDTDSIDTCSGVGAPAGSTVAAQGQDFVTCSA